MNLDQLISQPEGSTLDFKRDLSSLAKVVRTIAAIANTANGTVIIGVDDDKTVAGLKDPLKDEERLARAVANSIEPLLLVNIQHASRESASVLVIDVPFSQRPYYLRDLGPENGVYVREGSTNTLADPATIAELRRQAASQSFDLEAIPAVSGEDLDGARIRAAFSSILAASKLQTLGVTCQYSGRQVSTRTGVILFGTDEQRREHARDARMRDRASHRPEVTQDPCLAEAHGARRNRHSAGRASSHRPQTVDTGWRGNQALRLALRLALQVQSSYRRVRFAHRAGIRTESTASAADARERGARRLRHAASSHGAAVRTRAATTHLKPERATRWKDPPALPKLSQHERFLSAPESTWGSRKPLR